MFREMPVCPDFGKPFIHTTDPSKVTVEDVLLHEHDGIDRPVTFASPAERNNSASEQAMLTVIKGTIYLRSYLNRLTCLRNFSDNNARLTRWALRPLVQDLTLFINQRLR
jgi:hypothetical protein